MDVVASSLRGVMVCTVTVTASFSAAFCYHQCDDSEAEYDSSESLDDGGARKHHVAKFKACQAFNLKLKQLSQAGTEVPQAGLKPST